MPAPTAPGADWRKARIEFEAGTKSRREIAQAIGVTPQAVDKRARHEGWHKPSTARDTVPVSERWLTRVDELGIAEEPTIRRTRRAAAILADGIARGLPDVLAAPLAGMRRETYAEWRDSDEKLKQLLEEAAAAFASDRVANLTDAAERGDAQTVRWWLERHSATREHFRPAESAGGLQIHVAFGFMPQMPDAAPTSAPVITVDAVQDGAELQIEGPKADK